MFLAFKRTFLGLKLTFWKLGQLYKGVKHWDGNILTKKLLNQPQWDYLNRGADKIISDSYK